MEEGGTDRNGSLVDQEMRAWVRERMVTDQLGVLKANRDRAARVASVNQDGSVTVLGGESRSATERVLAYFIGKHYAVAGGFAADAAVTNQELIVGLGMPKGTVGRVVKELRDDHLVRALDEGRHTLPLGNLLRALDSFERDSSGNQTH